jgi:hypothetical protein
MGDWPHFSTWIRRPVGAVGTFGLVSLIVLAPAWLFGGALESYRLYSDDFAYVAASRTWPRTLESLFGPHNTHIVPAWRLLTWALVAGAGRLANLQAVFAGAAYGILAAVMLLMGRLVARETGRTVVGLAAMVVVGTTSLMQSAATWYSASQTLWAGFGILSTLWYLQGWRRSGGAWRLVLAGLAAWVASGFWSIGHAAGPVGAVYLWADGRPHCRRVAWIPLVATLLFVAIIMSLGGRRINATISFGGRTTLEATKPLQGVLHTLQAIPENLIFGNLGLTPETTAAQGAVLTLALVAVWFATVRRRRWANPLECAGAALVLVSSLVEWSVRGYLPFSSLRGLVPWYDTIPDIGFVLFLAGWWAGPGPGPQAKGREPLTRGGALTILALQAALLTLHQPRAEAQFQARLPAMTEEEARVLPIPELRHLRAAFLATERARWQRGYWKQLDLAERVARQQGIGRKAIGAAFGRLVAPEISDVYDAADMLDLPWEGTEMNPIRVREALGRFVIPEPDPVPPGALLKVLGIRRIPPRRKMDHR